MTFTISSPAFADGAVIPRRFTGDGENLSPPLEWRDAPAGTKSFALIVEDPDAPSGTFRHWGIYDIPGGTTRIAEGGGAFPSTKTDFNRQGYGGPRPPKGHGPHHYHFRLGALDVDHLKVPPKATVEEMWAAARPHLLGEAAMIGIYER